MRDGPKVLEDVIAPLDRDRFVSTYWTRSHLHLKGQKGRFSSLLSWDDLNNILEWQRPSPLQLRLYHDGRKIDPQFYIDNPSSEPRLNAGFLTAALSEGASLVLDDVQAIVPRIARLTAALQDNLRASTIANLYVGSGRQKAFNLHWDPQEVFILQLSGRKHWQVHAPTNTHPMKGDPEQVPEPNGPPLWTGILEDGDMLYLPRGYWHLVTPIGEPSLHLNIAVDPPDCAEFLRWWFPKLLSHSGLRQYLPLAGDGTVRQDFFAGVLQTIAGDGQSRDRAQEFLQEWNAAKIRALPRMRLPLSLAEQKAPIAMTTHIRLAQHDRLFIECKPGDSEASFRAVGRRYFVAPQLVPALKRLSGRKSLAVGELCQENGNPELVAPFIAMLETLARDGIILKESPEASIGEVDSHGPDPMRVTPIE